MESDTELDLNELINHVSEIKLNPIRNVIPSGYPDELVSMMQRRDFGGMTTLEQGFYSKAASISVFSFEIWNSGYLFRSSKPNDRV